LAGAASAISYEAPVLKRVDGRRMPSNTLFVKAFIELLVIRQVTLYIRHMTENQV